MDEARQIGEEYGVEVDGYTTGARNTGQAIVEEAQRLGVEVDSLQMTIIRIA